MRFGINFFPTLGPSDRSAAQYYDESLRLTELADELGFDHVKTVEHYFFRYGGYSPDPVTFLAAAAARTRRLRLVTGAAIPAFTHPVKLAAKLAMLDNISRGRLDVGFGRAFLPDEFEAFQVPLDESRDRFDENVEAIRRLWTEQDLVWEGRFHRFGPVTLLPRPYQRPHPPILVATAFTPESGERAGRNGYGVLLVPSISSREHVQEMLRVYRAGRAEGGHDPQGGQVHMSYTLSVAEDGDRAREAGRRQIEHYTASLVEAVESWGRARSSAYAGYERLAEKVRKADYRQQLAENKVLAGTPEEVAAQLAEVREWFGDVTVSLQVNSGTATYREAEQSLRLFAEHVLPRLGAAGSPVGS
ncbi:LLM class flavin-dependent oxidoreductase [Saccharothrix sp. S26]|uniref:LLM class flavin-dependent oxidoreductase n=1 Tax=Saccharothrix sp. S26 TaxID=2907215 RepID=UPI001F462F09|nr:LLM class flavin-dependent oxidoreductase [Saccharothrix sp. S26]MCE6995364.1 LLM class flavin-dependent oxidoreductase [Saccharothrix sp. S26]